MQQHFNSIVFKVSVPKQRNTMCGHSCNADLNPGISGTAQKHFKIQKMFVKASHGSQSSLELLDLHGGLLRSRAAPFGLRTVGLLAALSLLLPIYGAFLIFVSHTLTFSSLSLGLFHRALRRSLMRGKNTTAMKSPRLLRAFFSKLALSSPPERFLQIPVWGIVNTNFSLLKSPHIHAMLSFEWRTQGRPLNSFIVGFKTLHFKKYKSYSQMNEAERGDWREGLLMCPVGRARAESISPSCSNPLSSEMAPLSLWPSSAHMAPVRFLSLHPKLAHKHNNSSSTAWQWWAIL